MEYIKQLKITSYKGFIVHARVECDDDPLEVAALVPTPTSCERDFLWTFDYDEPSTTIQRLPVIDGVTDVTLGKLLLILKKNDDTFVQISASSYVSACKDGEGPSDIKASIHATWEVASYKSQIHSWLKSVESQSSMENDQSIITWLESVKGASLQPCAAPDNALKPINFDNVGGSLFASDHLTEDIFNNKWKKGWQVVKWGKDGSFKLDKAPNKKEENTLFFAAFGVKTPRFEADEQVSSGSKRPVDGGKSQAAKKKKSSDEDRGQDLIAAITKYIDEVKSSNETLANAVEALQAENKKLKTELDIVNATPFMEQKALLESQLQQALSENALLVEENNRLTSKAGK